jgi:hypothetical protein
MKIRVAPGLTHESWHRAGILDGFAVLALLITFILRYAPFLTSHLLFGPFSDNVHMYGPIFSEVSRLSLSGEVPYYLPDIGTGFPVFESPHFSILYPFYFFGLLDYGGPVASLYTLTHLTLVHVFVFYVNLYVLLRCATISPWASYIGASVGMLAWNTTLYATWITITASYAWLPLLLAGAVLLVRYPGKGSGIILFSTAAGLLALASPSQPVIHAALVCLIFFTVGIGWICLQRRFSDVSRVALSLVVCAGIAFGLAGAAILPMSIATAQMIRHIGNTAAVIGHARIPWENFNLHQFLLNQAIGILIRPTWINIVGSPYVGPLGCIGALLTAIYLRRLDPFLRALALAFAVIALYGLLSGFGSNLGVAYLNFHLPLLNRIREAGRHLVLFVIGVSFLNGVGCSLAAQSLQQYKQIHNARLIIVPLVLMLVFVGIISWELFQTNYIQTRNRLSILAAAPILYVLGAAWKLRSYKTVVSAAALVSATGLIIPVWGVSEQHSDFEKPMNLLSHRVIQSFTNKIDAANYRMEFRDANFPRSFWAMNASYYGIKSFYNQITPQPYAQFRFSLLADVPHLRAMMGARYVLCGPNTWPIDPDAKQILETEDYRLYENPNPMGRLTLVHRVAHQSNSEAGFAKVIRKGFNYFSEAYVMPRDFKRVRAFLGNSQALPPAQDHIVRIVDHANRSYTAVESDSPSLMILNEWFTPAWKARVNGKKQSPLQINEWQTGVLLPAGKNRVEFEYRPTLFQVLMALNRITIVLLLLYGTIVIIRQERAIWRHDRHLRQDWSEADTQN